MDPPLLGVAVLQLETRPVGKDENLAHVEALLDAECQRLGVRRWDGGSGDAAGTSGGVHLDICVLPEIFNAGYLVCEVAWYQGEGLGDPQRSPSLAALARWARRYRCYLAATLLEATREGHVYNSLVLAAPDGSFVTQPGGSGGGGSGKNSGGGVSLVRKHSASSLEGFVFRSAGPAGRGGEPAAHIVGLDVEPLLAKRRVGSAAVRSSGGGGGGSSDAPGAGVLRCAFSVCYENMCWAPMQAILEAHQRQPIQLLISPFCAMRPAHDHPTFSWPAAAADRLAAQAVCVSGMHAAKLGVHVAACHHTGALPALEPGTWASPLPRLLPLLPHSEVPISGPMLGCSALYAPGGSPLVQLGRNEERMALAHLPLLQPPGTTGAAPCSPAAAGGWAAAVGAAAAASAAAGPATPYARYFGGFVVEPVSWHMRLGFRLMEALGSLSYHVWRSGVRRRMAAAIARDGAWQGPVPAL